MPLRVYNTLTRQKEPFQPLEAGKVRMYLCGPTVYKPSHVGHMVGPIIFDTVKRYLTHQGYAVNWIVNITDVDDKLIKRAAELGTSVEDLATKMTADYKACLHKLGVIGIDKFPKATEHIPEMISLIQTLIDKGYAYPAAGDVYFDVSKDDDYGKLCNRDPEQMEAGARIEVSDRKRNPGDFALWKGAKPGEPEWESPWGPGRPGWHIECSAMAMKHLGKTLDIHGGGLDLQFPHHENELAQSESATGEPFARVWMHNGLMKLGASKMAGSVGNVINVVDLLQTVPAETVRYLILSSHYRSPIDYSEDRLAEAQRALDGFHRFFERYQRITGVSYFDDPLWIPLTNVEVVTPTPAKATKKKPAKAPKTEDGPLLTEAKQHRQKFLDHMDDDFNTGGALGATFELLSALNRYADQQQLEDPAKRTQDGVNEFKSGTTVLAEIGYILGLFQDAPPKKATGADEGVVTGLMQLLVDLRQEARKAKNFALGDQIRQRLTALGITLEDRAGGTSWRLP